MHHPIKAKLGESAPKKKDMIAENIADSLGLPIMGDASERMWADTMLHFTKNKIKSRSKPGYQVLDHNWLLIYDNWELPSVYIEHAIPQFHEHCLANSVFEEYERVFVVSERHVSYVEREQAHIL